MGRERRYTVAAIGDEAAEFAAYLYAVYRDGWGGQLAFDAFKVQQLTVDLIAEFALADRDMRRGLIADVLNLLSKEDFEAEEDEHDEKAVRQKRPPQTAG
jgi:hypothetical protein